MSRADLWNQRYLSKQAAASTLPAALQASLDQLPPGRTLDLACGDGAASLSLAAQGHQVVAVDFSTEGLQRLQGFAAERQLEIETRESDLSAPQALTGLTGDFDNIVILRYLPEASLLAQLPRYMKPAARLLIQTFNREQHRQTGFPERFCLQPGALSDTLPSLTLQTYDNGLLTGSPFDRYIFVSK
ncbi:methyltransferase domain-containing protein [Amphritea sp. 1_MG-2023]|uniref:class I SAM-dependent methyltransferase n=1 Tax=Amphritea sp. 1_MG-2023 TaxID=3062670 RepID=UPI0026E39DFB|nr:methyltransferase domain-containing protein [Amphritea sp. 1_MG-2023]MDO6563140.1 methyltransferase domain-containing protein [Amphritea sp. 1_MG-2023]